MKFNTFLSFLILMLGVVPVVLAGNILTEPLADKASSKIEVFTFMSSGKKMNGKIYLPSTYNSNKNLPTIYLIDFTEQHFKLATDEFEKVIDGVSQLSGFDALIVSLEDIPDINAEPGKFEEHYSIFKDLSSFVDGRYDNNSSRTFIGKGSESGLVLMALFLEDRDKPLFENFIVTDPSPKYMSAIISIIERGDFPKNKSNLKLHYSFSTSNNRELCTNLIKSIKEAKYKWLQFESIEYTNSDFENTYPISYADGIKYIFSK